MNKKDNPSSPYMKYGGLAFQMFFLLYLGWWIGSWIDDYFSFVKPYAGIGLAFIMLIGFFVKLYYDLEQGRL